MESHPNNQGAPLLEMAGISKRFGATLALDSVDLVVNAGEVLALVGENGAGKSTLMKILSGAHPPDSGAMRLAGRPYRPRNPMQARREGVAMIYQELSLAPDLSVAENILLGMEPGRRGLLDWKSLRERAARAMEAVGHPLVPLDTPARQLSVAMQQLVEVARAVAVGCRVLVLDEPTSSLTRQDIARLFDLIRRLRAQGHGVIYISHFLEEVKEVSDRFVVLRDGARVGAGVTSEATQAQIIALMVGRDVSELYPRSERAPGEIVLDVRDLAGARNPRAASLSLRRGEVLGIAGLVGAGRTELLRAIFGLDPVKKGQVKVAMVSGAGSPAGRLRAGVGLLSEDRKNEGLALGLSITENLTLTRLPALLSPRRLDREADFWARKMGVRGAGVSQRVGDLSGGNQQKVALARLLRHDADVLLLDEPTRGIDVASKAQIYRMIDDLATQKKAVLMVSSYLPELLGVCDRIAVMCRGALGEARPVGEWDEHRIMAQAIGAA